MFHRPFRIGIGHRADGQGNKGLIGMEPGIVVAQMRYLEVLDGFDNLRRNEMQAVVQASQYLEGIEQSCRRRAQQR